MGQILFYLQNRQKQCGIELLTVHFSDECALQLNRHIYFGDISTKLDRFLSPVHTLAYYYSQIMFGEANTWVKFCCEIFLNPWLFFRDFSIFFEHIKEPRITATSICKCFYSTRKGQVLFSFSPPYLICLYLADAHCLYFTARYAPQTASTIQWAHIPLQHQQKRERKRGFARTACIFSVRKCLKFPNILAGF